jgi:RNA polymerase sigma-70 factor (ECF subfamily)
VSGDDRPSWGRLQSYVRFLAESQIDPALNARLDLSGIVQQTLLEAYQSATTEKRAISLPWLRQVLTNNLTDEIRRLRTGKRDIGREMSLSRGIEQSSMRLESLLADRSPTPAEQIVQQEQVLNLSAALEKLPQTQREALILQVWKGWTLADIADHMGKTQQAVAGLLKRGMRQLRDHMATSESSSNLSGL